MRTFFSLILLLLVAQDVCSAPPKPVTALKGLDPVELVQGRELAGKENLAVEHGLYRYLFATERNKAAFEKDKAKYSIQIAGSCARMGPLSGLGNPDRFLVHGGRIFIFASDACRNAFEAAPLKFLDVPEPLLEGSPKEIQRGKELVALALKGLGGADQVDAVRNLQWRTVQKYTKQEKEEQYVTSATVVFPDRFVKEFTWEGKHDAMTVAGAIGFREQDSAAWDMQDFERDHLAREFYRHPVVLLRLRSRPDFTALGGDKLTIDGVDAETLRIGLIGVQYQLGVDLKSGRVLSVTCLGRGARGIAPIERRFSDFRNVQGLTLPFAVRGYAEGKPLSDKPASYDAIEVNRKLPPGFADKPK